MRLIDADALKTKAETIQTIDCWHMRTEEQAVLVEHIDNAPTIDAVPKTQCLDCQFNGKYSGIDLRKINATG